MEIIRANNARIPGYIAIFKEGLCESLSPKVISSSKLVENSKAQKAAIYKPILQKMMNRN